MGIKSFKYYPVFSVVINVGFAVIVGCLGSCYFTIFTEYSSSTSFLSSINDIYAYLSMICTDWNRNYFYLQLVSEDNVVWKSLKSNLKKYIFQMALLYCTCPNPTSHIISKVELFNSLLIAIAVSVLRANLEVHCQDWNRSLTLYLSVKLSLYIIKCIPSYLHFKVL